MFIWKKLLRSKFDQKYVKMKLILPFFFCIFSIAIIIQ